MPIYTPVFSASHNRVTYHGMSITNKNEFEDYLQDRVRRRLIDADDNERDPFDSDLLSLATTEMAVETVKLLLNSRPPAKPWQVGEALAECFLEEKNGVKWPWNDKRDKRTPKASLPGADLVGFIGEADNVFLAWGEVKTSDDVSTPPNLMYGNEGMIYQLDTLATRIEVHASLLEWLYARCENTKFWPMYQTAVRRYLDSRGCAVMLFGVLLRDTKPNELDVKNRSRTLSTKVRDPTRVEIFVLYLPHFIKDWPSLVDGVVCPGS
ncbi:MAG: hypothetical protein M3Z04_13940 [Chloroflexota bacterium]|nr:hypothetical protein [Chloroflexota bacterium]